MRAEGEAPGSTPAIRVRGRPSPEEVAAVIAALAAPAPTVPRRATPPWLRAGLREGLGEAAAAAPEDLWEGRGGPPRPAPNAMS